MKGYQMGLHPVPPDAVVTRRPSSPLDLGLQSTLDSIPLAKDDLFCSVHNHIREKI